MSSAPLADRYPGAAAYSTAEQNRKALLRISNTPRRGSQTDTRAASTMAQGRAQGWGLGLGS